MIENFNLSQNVTFYDLTRTEHADLLDENRNCTREELLKLALCANQIEMIRMILDCEIDKHSGRRYLELNKRVGGSERSEHLKCQAVDWSPAGPDTLETIEAAFWALVAAARSGKLKFGQMIIESSKNGREGRKFWIHTSLGAPHRDPARCGELLRIVDGKTEVLGIIKEAQ